MVWVTRAVTRGWEFPSLYSAWGVQVTSWIRVYLDSLFEQSALVKPAGVAQLIDDVVRGYEVADVR